MVTYKFKLAAPWEEVKEKMKENDYRLSDEDLEYEPGKEEELLDRLEKIMQQPKEAIVLYIESISGNERLSG